MQFIIEWGDFDINSGKKINIDENIEICNNALKYKHKIEDSVVDVLSKYQFNEFFNIEFGTLSQYELVLEIKENGKSSHIEVSKELEDEIIFAITNHLSSWVDTPYVREDDSIVNPDISEIKVKR